jgi:hypothetical protein
LYAWREIDHASALFRVDAPGFDPGTIGLISHFTVTDFRAHWRGGDKQKHRCDLPACTNRLDGDSGQGPFYPLSGTNGYTSVSRADQTSPLAVRICPDNEASNLVPCQLAKPLPLSTKDVDDTNIFPHEKAVAVSKDDLVYTAGADDAGALQIGKTPAVEGAEYVPLRTLQGAEVTAIAVNTNELFVAITTASGEGHLYRFPR